MKTIEQHKKEQLEFQRKEIIDEINNCNDVEKREKLLEKVRNSDDPVLIREILTKTILTDSDKEKLLKALRAKHDSAYFTQQLVYLYSKDAMALSSSFGGANNFRDYILSDGYLDTDNIPQELLDTIDSKAKSESNNMMIIARTMIDQHILPYANEDKLPVVDLHYSSDKSYKSK